MIAQRGLVGAGVRRLLPRQLDRADRSGVRPWRRWRWPSRRSLRAYFSGQDLALGVIAVPLLAAVSFALAAVAGHPVDGFLAATAMDLAGLGARRWA